MTCSSLLLALPLALGQVTPGTDVEPAPLAIRSSDYQIGPDDILHISVLGHEDLDLSVLVQADGGFIFPLIGRVSATDLTPGELEQLLAERLASGFIRDPQVTVVVEEFRSKTVLVLGEVAHPGAYPLSGSMRIVEVLASAGIQSDAANEVVVLRPRSEDGGPVAGPQSLIHKESDRDAEILRVDMAAIQNGDLNQNIRLRPNDTVFVPPPPRFYVQGEVRSPGAYPITPGLSIREGITVAGGFTDDASAGRTRVIREIDGEKREIKVELDAPVLPGDTIVVKGSLF
jgi:polysaccharide export outer membrane protein